jgi:hypothetical protein
MNPMKPRLDPLDFIVAFGMFATSVGGLLLVVATYGAGGVPPPKSETPLTVMSVMRSLQTAMGREIVETATLDYTFTNASNHANATLARSSRNLEAFSQKPPIAEVVQARFAQAKAKHEGQIQYLMGKSIVTLTGQGVRAGALTVDTLDGPTNSRIINTAVRYGQLGQKRFNGQSQALLGRWISEESRFRQGLHAHLQERIGEAIVQKASLEHSYRMAKSDRQTQLEALTAAALRSEIPPVRVANLPPSGSEIQEARMMATPWDTRIQVSLSGLWSDMFFTYAVMLLILLPAILIWSLTFPRISLERPIDIERILQVSAGQWR